MANFISLYIMSVVIAFLGMKYKYAFSTRYKGGNFTNKDWELVLIPFLNTLIMFVAVALILFDLAFKIADRYDA
ncbi:hypothetical protein [Bacillus wiedmannii]|uniref:Uncharacterized protein n=1 Tax=Bacillus wiedmannii TaxID=1890302 RepID=A0A2C4PZI5_9BACI|nr:hypothetical protein [Bacillus wiedmannii]PHD57691.1 hypothetical protein COF57_22735 [Bacillus wiedmannii]